MDPEQPDLDPHCLSKRLQIFQHTTKAYDFLLICARRVNNAVHCIIRSEFLMKSLQGFPGRRILHLLLSKTSLGPQKNYHLRPLGLAIICEEVKKELMITFLRVIPA